MNEKTARIRTHKSFREGETKIIMRKRCGVQLNISRRIRHVRISGGTPSGDDVENIYYNNFASSVAGRR